MLSLKRKKMVAVTIRADAIVPQKKEVTPTQGIMTSDNILRYLNLKLGVFELLLILY